MDSDKPITADSLLADAFCALPREYACWRLASKNQRGKWVLWGGKITTAKIDWREARWQMKIAGYVCQTTGDQRGIFTKRGVLDIEMKMVDHDVAISLAKKR